MAESSIFTNAKVWINLALALPFVFAALAGWAAWQISDLSSALASRGEIVSGVITNKRVLGDNGAATDGQIPLSINFNIYYKFSTPSGEVKAQNDVLHRTAYDRFKIGQRVKVRYLPDDPDFNEIVSGRKNSSNATAAAWMAIFFAAIGFLAIYLVKISPLVQKEPAENQVNKDT